MAFIHISVLQLIVLNYVLKDQKIFTFGIKYCKLSQIGAGWSMGAYERDWAK